MRWNPFQPFATYLRPYKWPIVLGLVLLVIVQAITMVVPMVLKWAIDAAKAGLDANQTGHLGAALARYALLLAGLALLHWGISFAMRWYLTSASRRAERDIRQAYVRHLLKLPLSFFQQQSVGDLMARATNDVEAIQRFLNFGFRLSLMALLTFVMAMGLMCTIDVKLALYALLPMPLMVVSARWVSGQVRSGYRLVQEQFASMSAHLQENLTGMRVVKAYARGGAETEHFADLNQEYVDRNRRLIYLRSIFFPFTFLLNGVSLVIILWLGGRQVIAGTLTLGELVAFNAYLIQMSQPMTMLGRMVDEYQRAVASMTRIHKILAEEPQTREIAPSVDPAPLRGEIEFQKVSVVYNDRPALDNVTVKVPAGSTLALVGRVGSGKSTLARLVPQLLQAGAGQILIDGIPVEDLPLATVRAAIGYVPQDTFLFSDTLRENIALGTEEEEGEPNEVEWATEIAQLTPDLENLPEGLETVIGERGVTLSGGQKQRAALARAVIREPRILVLDDALSSVDAKTEAEILQRLRQVMAERTTIIISHRISTVQDADHIVVLDEGKKVEQGTHDELIAADGIYADLYRRQHLQEELSEL